MKMFDEACLAEYAATFPIVDGDFSFYQFLSPRAARLAQRSANRPRRLLRHEDCDYQTATDYQTC
jgi:hypothetical protein